MQPSSNPVTLNVKGTSSNRLEFRSATIIPAQAMMVYQIRVNLPAMGEIDILESPPLPVGLSRLNRSEGDLNGNASFSMGASFLAPFANRIRGILVPGERKIETIIAGRTTRLPANGGGSIPGAQQYAIHGLILDAAAEIADRRELSDGQSVTGRPEAGDFGGRWFSASFMTFELCLSTHAFNAYVCIKNTGLEILPVGLGWHPYFKIPSNLRGQARLSLPAKSRLLVNDYEDVLPTGKSKIVRGTQYDFNVPDGKELSDLYLGSGPVNLLACVATA